MKINNTDLLKVVSALNYISEIVKNIDGYISISEYKDKITIHLSEVSFLRNFTSYEANRSSIDNDELFVNLGNVKIFCLLSKSKINKSASLEYEHISKAIEIVKTDRRASCSHLQRKLRIGYNQASIIIDHLEQMGIIGPHIGSAKREIFIDENPPEFTEEG